MPEIISSFLPFPNIAWWAHAAQATAVCFDEAEHFEKMSYRNRYYLAGANGVVQLSVPLVHGRNQRAIMRDVLISDREQWQVTHWRTITSVYRRAPYFEHYEQAIHGLFQQPFHSLIQFNLATVQWLQAQLSFSFEVTTTQKYENQYGEDIIDLRNLKPRTEKVTLTTFPSYYQLFGDRNGFLPNMSVLDLLFSEGPYSGFWIKEHIKNILPV